MTNFIPLFPLAIVVFPGEELNLHIFEPRYKQLVNDCFAAKKPFGIPSVINDKVSELGTLVEITEISKQYDNGEMDIKTKATVIFKVLEPIAELPDKLYRGAIVTYPRTGYGGNPALMKKVLKAIRDLHGLLNVSKDFKKPDEELLSFDIAHHAGMPIEDEYQVLEFEEELHRQEYIKRHIIKVLAVMAEMDQLKAKIKLNGILKTLGDINFLKIIT
ncbi:MAG: LON peptidase substrate-binding domain-containing protein [Ferruginibacter sp.]